MNLKLLIPVGLLALCIGLVIHLPAPVASGWVETQIPGLRLTGVSGDVFTGRAQYVGINDITLEDVRWQFSPMGLLLGRADINLKMSTDTGSVSADVSHSVLGNTRLQNVNGNASLSWLGGLAGYRFVPMDGLLNLQDVSADIEAQNLLHAKGQAVINNANWLLFKPPITFGSFKAALGSKGEVNSLEVIDSDGPLQVQGGVRMGANRGYVVDIRMRARAGADQRLKKILDQLGKADTEGWYKIDERGRL